MHVNVRWAGQSGKAYDLITGPLKGQKLKMHRTDAKTGEKTVIELGEK